MKSLNLNFIKFRREILLILTILISLFGLTGWAFNISLLKGDFRNYIPIAPLVSICFFLLSLSILIIFTTNNKFSHRIAKTILYVLFSVVLLIFIEHIFSLKFDIEKVFGTIQQPFSGNIQKGRMSPVTSAIFILVILSLFLSFSKYRRLKFSASIISLIIGG